MVTPTRDERKERGLLIPCLFRRRSPTETKPGRRGSDNQDESSSYFIHKPFHWFHHPPRTLRLGATNHGPVLCLVYNSWFWRRWKLQFGVGLSGEAVVDPRGAVSWHRHSTNNEDPSPKRYDSPSQSLRAGSSKPQRHDPLAKRIEHDTTEKLHSSVPASPSKPGVQVQPPPLPPTPPTAPEATSLTWTSPFSSTPRRYHFRHAGLDFHWKGTGAVQERRARGPFVRFNHLKLVVALPPGPDPDPAARTELCLARYTSALACGKAGVLELHEAPILRLLRKLGEAGGGTALGARDDDDGHAAPAPAVGAAAVRCAGLYDMIVATAVCMVVGEWQKRGWLKRVLQLVASEASGNF